MERLKRLTEFPLLSGQTTTKSCFSKSSVVTPITMTRINMEISLNSEMKKWVGFNILVSKQFLRG